MPVLMVPAAPLLVLTALLVACGGDSDDATTTPASPDANPADVEVIDAWSSALRDGDVATAARFFAIPSTAQNGPTIRIRSRADARLFNRSLPCGAVLVSARSQGAFTTATFELTERPGPGVCGPGTGAEAETAFVIEGGKIVEWRRVATGAVPDAPSDAI